MADAGTSPELRGALSTLTALTGHAAADPDDGHARWALYRAALASGNTRQALLAAMDAEPDAALASAVVGAALEQVPRAEREAWVRTLPPSVRGFNERRARELAVLEDLRSGAVPPEPGPAVADGWSDWLQLRIAAEVPDATVLRLLAGAGRTKRVRRAAAEALGRRHR